MTPARRLIPDAVTIARPLIGIACAVALAFGEAELAAWLYIGGYLSDVTDGLLARALGVSSARGRWLDGWADTIFHALVGAGLTVRAIHGSRWWVVVVLACLPAGGRILQRWATPYSVVGKAIAGGYRIAVFSLFLPFVDATGRPALIVAGIAVVATTYTYEGRVTLRELRSGERSRR